MNYFKKAQRNYAAYWDEVNLYSVVYEDLEKLYAAIDKLSYDGIDYIRIGTAENSELCPRYMLTPSVKNLQEINEKEFTIHEKRAKIFKEILVKQGFKVKDQKHPELDFSCNYIIEW